MKLCFFLLLSFLLLSEAYQRDDCERICLSNHMDVCYDDFQYLRRDDLIPNDVYVIGEGSCRDNYSKSCLSCVKRPQTFVCGSDNRTYINICELMCVAETNYGKLIPLVFIYTGKCREIQY